MKPVAFIDIDTQADFMEPGGKLYAQGAEAIRSNLARLVRLARAQAIPLVSSVDCHGPEDDEFSQYPPHCLKGTPGQAKIRETTTGREVFVPNTPSSRIPDPTRVHAVLEKQQFSVFSHQKAEQVFAATTARELVVFGVVTEVCVRFAVLGLLERGYRVQVVQDAIWPIDRKNGDAALAEFQKKGAVLTTTEAVLRAHGGML